MKLFASLGLISSLLVAACGDSGGPSTGTGGTTGTGTTTAEPTTAEPTTAEPTTTTSSTGATTTGGTSDSSGATTASTGASATATTTTDTGASATASGTSDSSSGGPGGDPLTLWLEDVVLYANCQPIVDPDNIIGSWTVVYDNTQGAAESSAELTSAVLTLSPDKMPSVHDITVAPTQSGPVPAGSSAEQTQTKQKAAAIPGCGHCDLPYKLELVFQSAGVDVPVVHEDTLPCVY